MKTQKTPIPGKSADELNANFKAYQKRVERSYKQVFNRPLCISDRPENEIKNK